MTTTRTLANVATATTLERLFDATLQFRSDAPDAAVVAPDGREGDYIGSGDGTVESPVIRGRIAWSLFSVNCSYPKTRAVRPVPDDLHICTLNPGGVITTENGVRIRFDGKGYGVRTPEWYRVSMTMVFGTEDEGLVWLTRVPGVMEGEFDERIGQATWRVYVQRRMADFAAE